MSEGASHNILVRGVNWIGDAVMTMPALRALRKAYPGARISLLVKPSVGPLFQGSPDIDELVLYNADYRGIAGKLRLSRLLRERGFSKAVLFQNAFDAALLAFLSGIPERIGYSRDGRGFLLTRPVAFSGEDRKVHHTRYYLNLVAAAGIRADYTEPWVSVPIEERLAARRVLSELKRPVLGINPGATYGSAKRWFPERFSEVADRFVQDTGGGIVLFGSKDEAGIAEEIERLATTRRSFLNLAGKTSLRELVALISECDVFLTNDSGPMHVAYAVGAPQVAIFGSTDPDLTGPLGGRDIVVKSGIECSPCFERTCREHGLKCMYAVTPDDVYRGIRKVLPVRRAVFFDRDGTLCRDADYLRKWDELEIFPEIDSLKEVRDDGFALIGVSNQSGIFRGIVEESFVKEVNRLFIDKYGFEDFYYCPHGPDERCPCRKPEPAMLLKARAEHGIDLRRSYVVGDKDADMLLAKAAGAQGILVRTGKQDQSPHADFTVKDLREAVGVIKKNG